MDIIQRQRYK